MILHWLVIALKWLSVAAVFSPFAWPIRVYLLRGKQNKQLAEDVDKKLELKEKTTPAELRTPFGTELLSDEEREDAILPEHSMEPWLGERKLSTLRSSEAEILAGMFSSKASDLNVWLVMLGFVAVLITPWSSKEVVTALLHPATEGHTRLAYLAVFCQLGAVYAPLVLKDKVDGLKARAELCWKRAEVARKTEKAEREKPAADRKPRRLAWFRSILERHHDH